MLWLGLFIAGSMIFFALDSNATQAVTGFLGINSMVTNPTPVVSLMAQLISQEEGYGDPNAIPTDYNNPGDLTNWPGYPVGSRGQGNITKFPTATIGWQALWTDLTNHINANPNQSIDAFIQSYAMQPPGSQYAINVANGFGVSIDTPLSQLVAA